MNTRTSIVPVIILALLSLALLFAGCGGDTATVPALGLTQEQTISAEPEPNPAADAARELAAVGPAPETISVFVMGEELRVDWIGWLNGDYNLDGSVGGQDLFPLAVHFGETATQSAGNECIDGNGDGTLNGLDLFTIAVNFENRIDGYFVYADDSAGGDFSDPALNDEPVPYLGCGADQSYVHQAAEFEYPFFAIKSYDEAGETQSELSAVAATPILPWAQNLSWQIDTGGLKLGWNRWGEALGVFDHWRIEMRESGGDWAVFPGVFDDNTADLTYGLVLYDVDTTLDGRLVDFRVTGESAEGAFGHYSTIEGVALTPVPDVPVALEATPQDGAIRLSWNAGEAENLIGYNVYSSSTLVGPYGRIPTGRAWGALDFSVEHTGAGTITFTDDSVLNEQAYYYAVTAVNDARGESDYTEAVEAVPSAPPAPPVNPSATGYEEYVVVRWDENSEPDLAGYNVYSSSDQEGPFALLVFIDINNYEDSFVEPGVLKYYRITAVDEHGVESAPSDVCSGRLTPQWRKSYVDFQRAGSHCSLAIDSQDVPGIAYRGVFEEELRYAHFSDGLYLLEEVDSDGDVGGYSSLAFDPIDNPAISYRDEDANVLKFAWFDGSDWGIEVVDDTADTGGFGTSLVFDGGGNPLIAYHDKTNDTLKLAWHDGSVFQLSTIDADGDVGRHPAMSLDISGNPAIAYLDNANTALKMAWFNGLDWDVSTVDNSAAVGSATVSLAFDQSGHPGISYGVAPSFAYWNGVSWNIESAGSESSVSYTSLGFDKDDNPLITYYVVQGSSLNYAMFDGIQWQTDLIDDDGVSGKYCSLAFDSTGVPYVAWYNSTMEDLYVAKYY